MRITEGGIEIETPSERDGASQGSGDDVFYNPTQELNRDITVGVLRAYADREPRASTYLDAMAASGIRGVRAAAEEYDVTCADIDPDAIALATENLEANDLDGETIHGDANAVMHQGYFDIIDLDPFGTPIPFADAAFANARDLVCVTATDTAPLCGAHQRSGIRKYSAVPQNTDYHPEMGLRTLIGALVRTAARYDTAATPILSHVSRHYVRTYLELDNRATQADAAIDDLGYIYHCEDCLERDHEYGLISTAVWESCPHCGSNRTLTAGPVWLGSIAEREFTSAVRSALSAEMGTQTRADRLLATIEGEIDTPTHYDQHRLCELWGVPANSMDEFIDSLQAAGYEASHAHYRGTAFKCPESIETIRQAAAPRPD